MTTKEFAKILQDKLTSEYGVGKEWRTPVWKLAYWSGGTLL